MDIYFFFKLLCLKLSKLPWLCTLIWLNTNYFYHRVVLAFTMCLLTYVAYHRLAKHYSCRYSYCVENIYLYPQFTCKVSCVWQPAMWSSLIMSVTREVRTSAPWVQGARTSGETPTPPPTPPVNSVNLCGLRPLPLPPALQPIIPPSVIRWTVCLRPAVWQTVCVTNLSRLFWHPGGRKPYLLARYRPRVWTRQAPSQLVATGSLWWGAAHRVWERRVDGGKGGVEDGWMCRHRTWEGLGWVGFDDKDTDVTDEIVNSLRQVLLTSPFVKK